MRELNEMIVVMKSLGENFDKLLQHFEMLKNFMIIMFGWWIISYLFLIVILVILLKNGRKT